MNIFSGNGYSMAVIIHAQLSGDIAFLRVRAFCSFHKLYSAHRGADARKKLSREKRLSDIIVCSGIENIGYRAFGYVFRNRDNGAGIILVQLFNGLYTLFHRIKRVNYKYIGRTRCKSGFAFPEAGSDCNLIACGGEKIFEQTGALTVNISHYNSAFQVCLPPV